MVRLRSFITKFNLGLTCNMKIWYISAISSTPSWLMRILKPCGPIRGNTVVNVMSEDASLYYPIKNIANSYGKLPVLTFLKRVQFITHCLVLNVPCPSRSCSLFLTPKDIGRRSFLYRRITQHNNVWWFKMKMYKNRGKLMAVAVDEHPEVGVEFTHYSSSYSQYL